MGTASEVQRDIRKAINNRAAYFVVMLTETFRDNNPVDTGWSSANWIPSVGKPFSGTAGTYDQARKGSVDFGPQQEGIFAIQRTYNARKVAYISNNAWYINHINNNIDPGFVQRSIAEAKAKAKALRAAGVIR